MGAYSDRPRPRGSGVRGSPPAPGRRAYGVCKVTLRSPTFSGGGGSPHEPFGDLPRRAPGERPPPAQRLRWGVGVRVDGEPRGAGSTVADPGWFLRNGFCLKCKAIHSTKRRNGASHLVPYLSKNDIRPRRRDGRRVTRCSLFNDTWAFGEQLCCAPPRFLPVICFTVTCEGTSTLATPFYQEVLKASFAFMSVRRKVSFAFISTVK